MKRMKVKALRKKSKWMNPKFVNPIFTTLCALMLVGGAFCLYLYFTYGAARGPTTTGGRSQFGFGVFTSSSVAMISGVFMVAAGIVGGYSSTKRYKIPAGVGLGMAASVFWIFTLINVFASGGFGTSNPLMYIVGPVVSFAYCIVAFTRNGILPRKNEDERIY